jgi:hypothetical protein
MGQIDRKEVANNIQLASSLNIVQRTVLQNASRSIFPMPYQGAVVI